MRKIVLSFFLLASMSVYACEIMASLNTPFVDVPALANLSTKWHKVAEKLGEIYGPDAYRDVQIDVVKINMKICLMGICGRSVETNMVKPCGQTVQEAAQRLSDDYASVGGGGSGVVAGSGSQLGGGPSNPFAVCHEHSYAIKSCVSGGGFPEGCRTDTYSELVCT